MPTSRKQRRANRRNARKSTGPRTHQGKTVARRNATTHGLHACDIVINSPHLKENPAQYRQLLESLTQELQPKGVFQEHLVVRIANCLWRYKRAINAETAHINAKLDSVPTLLLRNTCLDPDDPNFLKPAPHSGDTHDNPELQDYLAAQSIPSGSFCLNLLRYQVRLDRQLSRAYRLLRHLQYLDSMKSPRTPTTPNENRHAACARRVSTVEA